MESEKTIEVASAEEDVIYKSIVKFTDKKTAQIVKNSLDVDEEYSVNVKRAIQIEENQNGDILLILIYNFKANNIKNFKKSLKALYENMALVLETIRDFSPSNF